MAVPDTIPVDTSDEDALIRRHVDPNPDGRGRDEACLIDSGTPVWALIAYLSVAKGDAARVAHDYDVPLDAVLAALAYYRRNRKLIDARLLLNEA
ncbi:MAG: hypothetical protein ACRDJN_22650 [Chloroflexota bacterium]